MNKFYLYINNLNYLRKAIKNLFGDWGLGIDDISNYILWIT